MIEITTNENSPMRQEVFLMHQLTAVTFGAVFLGNVPDHIKIHPSAGQIYGFRGCIREFQVNNKELFVIDEATGGRNIENCNVPVCDYHPCRNGGTCTRPLYPDFFEKLILRPIPHKLIKVECSRSR
uniref:Uncharacterized protein n=1 Tax=Sphaerodactylus townsendi TaxID=933632 RepID=A0ACB8GDE2_9SAUR